MGLKERILPLLTDVNSPTGKEIIKILDEYEFRMRGCIEWCAEDFIERAKEAHGGFILTQDEAQEMLEEMIHRHDCNIGISWDVLDYHIGLKVPDDWVGQPENDNDTNIPENRQGEINPDR